MAKVVGMREQVHKPIYDTYFRGNGPTVVPAAALLFAAAAVGTVQTTNLDVQGALASDSTAVLLGMRIYASFLFGNTVTGDHKQYQRLCDETFWTLEVGDKPMFGPIGAWYFPAGGGAVGSIALSTTGLALATLGDAPGYAGNGIPSTEAILKFGKPIAVPARQAFRVRVQHFGIAAATLITVLAAQDNLDYGYCACVLETLTTRDVQ